MCSVLDSLLPARNEESLDKDGNGPSLGIGASVLESIFLAAVYWSLGASLIEESRTKFDSFVKKLASLNEVSGEGAVAGPGDVPTHYPTLYEYYFDQEQSKSVVPYKRLYEISKFLYTCTCKTQPPVNGGFSVYSCSVVKTIYGVLLSLYKNRHRAFFSYVV